MMKMSIENLPSSLKCHIESMATAGAKEVMLRLFQIKGSNKGQVSLKDTKLALNYLFDKFVRPDLEHFKKAKNELEEEKPEETKENGTKKSEQDKDQSIKESPGDKKKIFCKYFKDSGCKKGKDCEFLHPEQCKKFIEYGLKKFNNRGCESNRCHLLHPKVCKFSLIFGECKKGNLCRFKHLKKDAFKTSVKRLNKKNPPPSKNENSLPRRMHQQYESQRSHSKSSTEMSPPLCHSYSKGQTRHQQGPFLGLDLQTLIPIVTETVHKIMSQHSMTSHSQLLH